VVAVEATLGNADLAGEGVQLLEGRVARQVAPQASVLGHLRVVDEDRHPRSMAGAATLPPMADERTPVGGSAAPLDAALGLTRGEDDGAWTVLLLDPGELAVGSTEPVAYLHGGTLATCVDTAAWEALVRDHEGTWVVADLRLDFLRLARPQPHVVRAVVRRAGRRQAVVDVEIAAADDVERIVTLGRATLSRTD